VLLPVLALQRYQAMRSTAASVPYDVATLTEAVRRAVLQLFVKHELMGIETAQSMLAWPHSSFHVHDTVWAAADDKEFTVRLARYCARNPIALGRMEYDELQSAVTYHSDKPTGPTAGSETTDALEFLARVVSQSPTRARFYSDTMGRVRRLRLLRLAREPNRYAISHRSSNSQCSSRTGS